MEVESGGPTFGEDGWAAFVGETLVHGFPLRVSESLVFESAQAYRFSQYLTTTLCWVQDDPRKPRGGYGGVVNLWAVLMPHFY
jgi:hypothetical protein